jgi:hypothetical protein
MPEQAKGERADLQACAIRSEIVWYRDTWGRVDD